MPRTHHYQVDVTWTGNTGTGTSGLRDYERSHDIGAGGKPVIPGSSDPAFRGKADRWNPEELLVASLSQCHMLWFLAVCAQEGIVVTHYADHPSGTMVEDSDGGGRFTDVVLRPRVRIADPEQAGRLPAVHDRAHHLCFIANSVNFEVRTEPEVAETARPAHP
ncbi:MAG: OsmC family protein [Micromonosporaceae bacterium]|nr:OsmC family protein [Micromonosporaceae bacterium]